MAPSIVMMAVLVGLLFTVPEWNRSADEMRAMQAIKSIQTIHTVQVQYWEQTGRFAVSLAELGAADLIREDFASGSKYGYRFELTGTARGYEVHADPEVRGKKSKSFYSDQTMVIRENDGPEPATQNSREYGVAAK